MTAETDAANHSRNPLLGIAMILLAVFFFASMDAATKYLTSRYAPGLVVAMRYFLGAAIMVGVFWPRFGRRLTTWHRPKIVFARAVVMAASSLVATIAFRFLPVAETVAIVYLAPFGVLLLARPVLGETVRLSSWLAAAGGFLGLILIVRPGAGLDPVGVGFALAAAVGSTWYFVLTRMLASTEDTLALLFAVNLTGLAMFAPAVPLSLPEAMPPVKDIAVFGWAGAIALLGHYLVTAAYREATAAILAPLSYAHLFWAGLLGWLLFGHVPDAVTLLGIALIALSGAALAVWTQVTGRRKLRPPTS